MRHWIGLVSCAVLLVGCGSTIQTGSGGATDGGPPGSGSEPGAPAATLAPEAHFKKCSLACEAPADGPCATADVNACISKCTATLEGLAIACAQCLVENSGYTGERCEKVGEPGYPRSFGPRGRPGPGDSIDGGSEDPPPPLCTEALELCDGITMAKTNGWTCTDSCR